MQMKRLRIFFFLLFLSHLANAKKLALVVGIDDYAPAASPCIPPPQKERAFTLRDARTHKPACPNVAIHPLRRAVSDAAQFQNLLEDRFSFNKTEIHFLKNEEATSRNVLNTLNVLIDKQLQKGDVFIFYFAGHGTYVYNSSQESPSVRQGALVTYDYNLGGYPIMDFELASIYQKAIQKGIQINVVLDSCHAAAAARGRTYRTLSKPDSRISDRRPAGFDGRGSYAFLGAAQEGEAASDDSLTFTEALVETIQSVPIGLSVADLSRIVANKLFNQQRPVADGEAREKVDLGGRTVNREPSTYHVLQINNETIRIDGGSANGLTIGSEFVVANDSTNSSRFILRDLQPTSANLIMASGAKTPERGTPLRLAKWTPKPTNHFRVYVPATLPSVSSVEQFRIPLANRNPGPEQHTAEDTVPPTQELIRELQSSLGGHASLLTQDVSAQYEIVGRFRDGRLEYALAKRWITPEESLVTLSRWNRDWQVVKQADGSLKPLPYPSAEEVVDCRTAWKACGEILARRIQRNRVFFDFKALESVSSVISTGKDVRPIPWNLELSQFNRNGSDCGGDSLTTIVSEKLYCLKARYTGGPAGPEWYLRIVSIDGAGLIGDVWTSPTPVRTDQKVPFLSQSTEGNTENLFLFVCTDADLANWRLPDDYQQPPGESYKSRNSGREPVRAVLSLRIVVQPNGN
jgi:hypothetical protein